MPSAAPCTWSHEAGLYPRNNRGAGGQASGWTRKGKSHLKAALVTAAVAVAKTRAIYLGEKHRRLRARRGEMRAHVAIAHKLFCAVHHVLSRGANDADLRPGYLDQIDDSRTARHLMRRLLGAGYDEVEIKREAALYNPRNHPTEGLLVLFPW